jgi:hypothetical protein
MSFIFLITESGRFSEAIIRPSEWVVAILERASKLACLSS